MHKTPLITGSIMTFIAVAWMSCQSSPQVEQGKVYMRHGLPDSALVATILELSPNAAGELLVSIIAFDRLVKIDQVNACTEIDQMYAADSILTSVPLFIEPEDTHCFSYRIRFDFEAGDQLIPFHIALIHPLEHSDLLSDT